MKEPNRAVYHFQLVHTESQLKAKALQSSGLMLTSRIVVTLVQLAGTVIIARILSPEDFGLVAMVTSISLLLSNVGFNGFIEAIIQSDAIEHKQISKIFWVGLAISSVLAALFSLCSPLLARFYSEPRIIVISVVFATCFIFQALSTEHIALLMRNMEFKKIIINDISSIIISTLLAVAMALKGFGYWAIVSRQITIPIVIAAMSWIQCPWRPGFPVKDVSIKPFINFAINTYGNFATNYFGRNLDKILLGWKWGAQTLGNYDRAYGLFVLPVSQMVAPLTGVALATLSRIRHEPEKFIRYYLKSISMIALLGMFVSSFLTVSGIDIILLLFGEQWHKAGYIFTAFSPSIGITLIYGTHGWLHLSLGTPKRWFRWGLISLVALTIMICCGLFWGGLGVAIAYSFSFYLITMPALHYAGKPINLRASDIMRVLWKYLAASVISSIFAWVFIKNFSSDSGPLLRIIEAGILCAVIYFLVVILLFKGLEPLKEVVIIIKGVLSKPE